MSDSCQVMSDQVMSDSCQVMSDQVMSDSCQVMSAFCQVMSVLRQVMSDLKNIFPQTRVPECIPPPQRFLFRVIFLSFYLR